MTQMEEITLGDLVKERHRDNVARGQDFPYGKSDRNDWTISAAAGVLTELRGRNGIGDILDNFDDELRDDILAEVSLTIYAAYEESQKEKEKQ